MEKIKIPEFVKRMNSDDLLEFAKALSDGDVNVYTIVRDENNRIVGNKQVFSKMTITDELDYLSEKIDEKERCLKTSSIKYRKIIKREILFLKGLYRTFLECPTYLSLLDSEEIDEYNEMVELDLSETLSSIKTYAMKKTD